MSNDITKEWFAPGVGLVGLIGILLAYLFTKRRIPWIAGIAVAVLAIILVSYTWDASLLNEDLPWYFRLRLPYWIFAMGAASIAGMAYLVVSRRPAEGAGEVQETSEFADLESAWSQILAALAAARVEPGRLRWYLLFGPDPKQVEGVIDAAGVRTLAVAPQEPGAPMRAHLTPDGVILEASGCTSLFGGSASGEARLARLCELIRQLNPAVPPLRGIGMVLPIDWATDKKSSSRINLAREDLQRIADALLIRATVLVVFSHLEALPGTKEFLRRIEPRFLDARCGFSLPNGPFKGEPLNGGMLWQERWFRIWTLDLMANNYTETTGNAGLLQLAESVRSFRRPIEGLLNGVFAVAPDSEPFTLRGVYFCGNGEGEHEAGFAPGLLRGPKARLIVDHELASWSRAALREDRNDRRLSWILVCTTFVLGLIVWFDILKRCNSVSSSKGMFMAMIILVSLVIAWAVGFGRLYRQRRHTPVPAS